MAIKAVGTASTRRWYRCSAYLVLQGGVPEVFNCYQILAKRYQIVTTLLLYLRSQTDPAGMEFLQDLYLADVRAFC